MVDKRKNNCTIEISFRFVSPFRTKSMGFVQLVGQHFVGREKGWLWSKLSACSSLDLVCSCALPRGVPKDQAPFSVPARLGCRGDKKVARPYKQASSVCRLVRSHESKGVQRKYKRENRTHPHRSADSAHCK